jgi:hypothetical protein
VAKRSQERKHPAWAARDRAQNMAWIQENFHVLWPYAQEGYQTLGRGLVMVDASVIGIHPAGVGNLMVYLTQTDVEKLENADALRMISQYDPSWEMVIGLLQPQGRESFYRIGIPELRPRGAR